MNESAWYQKEEKRYLGKTVVYCDYEFTVERMFWDDREEKIVMYIEDKTGKTHKVFEENVKLLKEESELILVQIEVERLNETYITHKIVESQEALQEIKDDLEKTKNKLYSDSNFVGYYRYAVDVLDLETVLVSDLKITLKELKRLMDHQAIA